MKRGKKKKTSKTEFALYKTENGHLKNRKSEGLHIKSG